MATENSAARHNFSATQRSTFHLGASGKIMYSINNETGYGAL